MINSTELQKLYQAWQQGNDHYVEDWSYFVEWAARSLGTSGDAVLRELQKHYWFRQE